MRAQAAVPFTATNQAAAAQVNKANETAEMEHEKLLAELKRRADVMQAFTTHVAPYLGAADN